MSEQPRVQEVHITPEEAHAMILQMRSMQRMAEQYTMMPGLSYLRGCEESEFKQDASKELKQGRPESWEKVVGNEAAMCDWYKKKYPFIMDKFWEWFAKQQCDHILGVKGQEREACTDEPAPSEIPHQAHEQD